MKRRIHMGRRDQGHAFQGLETALGLAGLGGLGAKAVHKGAHMGYFTLLFIVCGLLLGQLFYTLLFKGRVITGIEGNVLLFHMGDAVNDAVQKVPIMGDQ